MIWSVSWRCDPGVRPLADRHYNRQSIGADNFVPPGRCLVLRTPAADAYWVTSWPFAEYARHAWSGAWICSAFRREGGDRRASDLIREAVAATRWRFGDPPALGIVTFIDPTKVRPTMVRGERVYGWTYRKAGFRDALCPLHSATFPAHDRPACEGRTQEDGLIALQLLVNDMPPPAPPRGATLRLALGEPLTDAA